MNKNIATTIEQSQRLIAAGVDPNTADMEWVDTGIGDTQILSVGQFVADATPAWSATALLDLLPPFMLEETKSLLDNDRQMYWLHVASTISNCEKKWVIAYGTWIPAFQANSDSLIEAAVQMIEILSSKMIKFFKK